ncbi:MAG: hypothetical protein AAF573_05865 [Bacteroidota bacterium]
MKKYLGFTLTTLPLIFLSTICSFSQVDEKEKKIGFHYSLPYINIFNLRPPTENRRIINTGFWGFELGLDYYRSKNTFFSLSGSANTDFFLPVPASPGIDSEYEIMSSIYLTTAYNKLFKRWLFSYGLTFGNNKWSLRVPEEVIATTSLEPRSESYAALGVQGQVNYFIKGKFYSGVIYRPTFYRFNVDPGGQYEHLISITIGMQIN